MANFPNYPPQGVSFSDVLADWPQAIFLGLYVGNPSICPPEPFATLPQPTFAGYTMQAAQDAQAEPAPPGTALVGKRLLGRYRLGNLQPDVTVNGWFAAVRFNDGTYATMTIEPFENPVTLTAAVPSVTVNVTLSAAPEGLAPGQQAVAAAAVAVQVAAGGGGPMANVFKTQQRAAQQSAIAALRQLLAWDAGRLALSPDSVLAPYPIFPLVGDATWLVPNPALPSGYADAATQLIGVLEDNLLATQ